MTTYRQAQNLATRDFWIDKVGAKYDTPLARLIYVAAVKDERALDRAYARLVDKRAAMGDERTPLRNGSGYFHWLLKDELGGQ